MRLVTMPDLFHVMAVLKELQQMIGGMRAELSALQDTLSHNTAGFAGVQIVYAVPAPADETVSDAESDSSDTCSVQSAPATVSYERVDE